MKSFSIRIELKSPLITPVQSDTLWGHICWAVRYGFGETTLKGILSAYETAYPPIQVSSAFPEGFLPMPRVRPLGKSDMLKIVRRFWKSKPIAPGLSVVTRMATLPMIPANMLNELSKQTLSAEVIVETLVGAQQICLKTGKPLLFSCPYKVFDLSGEMPCLPGLKGSPSCPSWAKIHQRKTATVDTVVIHSAINRLSGSAQDGALFTSIERHGEKVILEAFCRIEEPFSENLLKSCLEYINATGFGKKKSTGIGAIHCSLSSKEDIMTIEPANAFLTLSNYIPKSSDQTTGFYTTSTKYGKLGGHFASSPVNGAQAVLPFKYPLVMLMPGSVFQTTSSPMPFYGCIIKGVHPQMNEISHYGLAYPYPLRIEE